MKLDLTCCALSSFISPKENKRRYHIEDKWCVKLDMVMTFQQWFAVWSLES